MTPVVVTVLPARISRAPWLLMPVPPLEPVLLMVIGFGRVMLAPIWICRAVCGANEDCVGR